MSTDIPFVLSTYPIAIQVMLQPYLNVNEAISRLSTRNEGGANIAVGAVRPSNQSRPMDSLRRRHNSEAFAPVVRLSKIILGCVFGTAGTAMLLVPLLAHWSVAPIRRLRAAARKSDEPEIRPHHPVPEPRQTESEADDDRQGNTFEGAVEHMNENGSPAMWPKHLRRPLGRINSSQASAIQKAPRAFRYQPGSKKEDIVSRMSSRI